MYKITAEPVFSILSSVRTAVHYCESMLKPRRAHTYQRFNAIQSRDSNVYLRLASFRFIEIRRGVFVSRKNRVLQNLLKNFPHNIRGSDSFFFFSSALECKCG